MRPAGEARRIVSAPTAARVLEHARAYACGFLSADDIAVLAKDPATRLMPLLVRCGCGRFTAAAQDVQHFIDIIVAEGRDHVRDVSIPVRA